VIKAHVACCTDTE